MLASLVVSHQLAMDIKRSDCPAPRMSQRIPGELQSSRTLGRTKRRSTASSCPTKAVWWWLPSRPVAGGAADRVRLVIGWALSSSALAWIPFSNCGEEGGSGCCQCLCAKAFSTSLVFFSGRTRRAKRVCARFGRIGLNLICPSGHRSGSSFSFSSGMSASVFSADERVFSSVWWSRKTITWHAPLLFLGFFVVGTHSCFCVLYAPQLFFGGAICGTPVFFVCTFLHMFWHFACTSSFVALVCLVHFHCTRLSFFVDVCTRLHLFTFLFYIVCICFCIVSLT